MTGGTISYNSSGANGGGVAVLGFNSSNISTFTQSGGTISNNSATTTGGGVSIAVYGTYNLNGGTISSNTAGTNGGGVYDGGIFSGVFNMTAGTISGNTATGLGNGVYDSETFNIAPSGATFSIVDTIYLTSGTYINVGATVANITGNLTVQMATTSVGTTVTQLAGSYSTFTTGDLAKFAYSGGGHTFRLYPIVGTTKTQIQIAS
jgi:hypothetical protein